MNDAMKTLGKALCEKLGADDWCNAPGGGFFVKGHGHITTARARKLTGMSAEPRAARQIATTGAHGERNAFASLVLAASRGTR